MSLILHIETASTRCSVALSKDQELIAWKETDEKNSHSSVITLFIDDLLKKNGLTPKNLDVVAVSKGPGSYTGLRIGVSTAKGLCYAIDKPLISVTTLHAMIYGVRDSISNEFIKPNLLFCPMIDARRMEVYYGLYDIDGKIIKDISAEIIKEDFLSNELHTTKIIFFGDGSVKCKQILSHPNAVFTDNIMPSAKNMLIPVYEKLLIKQFEDIAYFEPFYLKDFIAGQSRVKGLR